MTNKYLTSEEIRGILQEAKKAKYARTNLLHLETNKLSIRNISQISNLILIYGNDDLGYKHIVDRHSLYSKKPIWIDKEKGKLDHKSRFSSKTPPSDYIWLAEKIYKKENLNKFKNYNSEVLDIYIGKFGDENLTEAEYKLLTYKNTGIIHTFYVCDNKKPFNKHKKKILDFQEGFVSTSRDLDNQIQTHKKPYYDNNGIERVTLILKVFEEIFFEKWYVQINSKKGDPIETIFLEENKVDDLFKAPFRRGLLDNQPLRKIEQKIKKILAIKRP